MPTDGDSEGGPIARGSVAGSKCDLLLMQHEVGLRLAPSLTPPAANQVGDLCADLCANSAKRDESDKNQDNVAAPVTLITATLRRPSTN